MVDMSAELLNIFAAFRDDDFPWTLPFHSHFAYGDFICKVTASEFVILIKVWYSWIKSVCCCYMHGEDHAQHTFWEFDVCSHAWGIVHLSMTKIHNSGLFSETVKKKKKKKKLWWLTAFHFQLKLLYSFGWPCCTYSIKARSMRCKWKFSFLSKIEVKLCIVTVVTVLHACTGIR